jgi:predicted Zn-ribbon and HTH transcriptional regulator
MPKDHAQNTITSPLSIKVVVNEIIERLTGELVWPPVCKTCGGKLNSYNGDIPYGYCPKCMDYAYLEDGTVHAFRD